MRRSTATQIVIERPMTRFFFLKFVLLGVACNSNARETNLNYLYTGFHPLGLKIYSLGSKLYFQNRRLVQKINLPLQIPDELPDEDDII